MITVYKNAQQVTQDPAGFVGDEIMGVYVGAAIIPGVILLVVLGILGIFAFSHLITSPSVLAQILFWILIFFGLVYATIAVVLGKLLTRIINKGKSMMNTSYTE